MNYIDLIILIVIITSIYIDLKRGFITSSLFLISWVGSLLAGFFICEPVGRVLLKLFSGLSYWATPLAFILTITVTRWLLDRLAGNVLDNVPESVEENRLNKIAGMLTGLINGFIWSALLATILLLMPLVQLSRDTRDARLTEGLISKVSWLEKKLSPIFSEALNNTVHKTTIDDETDVVSLPFIVKRPVYRPDIAAEMLAMVNDERQKRNLKPLLADPEMAVVARKHSEDMFLRGYFSHYTPEGIDPFQRMHDGNIKFYIAGENLALSQTLQLAHKGLMESPGHRANILNTAFGRIGIAVLDGGIYGLMITQNFRN